MDYPTLCLFLAKHFPPPPRSVFPKYQVILLRILANNRTWISLCRAGGRGAEWSCSLISSIRITCWLGAAETEGKTEPVTQGSSPFHTYWLPSFSPQNPSFQQDQVSCVLDNVMLIGVSFIQKTVPPHPENDQQPPLLHGPTAFKAPAELPWG